MRTSVIVLGLTLASLGGCQKRETATPALPPPTREVRKVPFVPPADSSITAEQLRKWLACHELLDSLSFRYADSFKTNDAERRLVYQQDFTQAQDRVCVLAGLSGGYHEYQWILAAIGNPRNRQLADSLKIGIQ